MIEFGSLYQTYAADVFRFALYLSGNRSDAEDITAETFVRAWAARDSIEVETVKGYLFAIAKNLFLKGLRKSARSQPRAGDRPDLGATAYDRIEQRQHLDAVLTAIQKLPPVDRAALVMRTLDELPYQEIARILEITETSAKVKVHRARAALMGLRRI